MNHKTNQMGVYYLRISPKKDIHSFLYETKLNILGGWAVPFKGGALQTDCKNHKFRIRGIRDSKHGGKLVVISNRNMTHDEIKSAIFNTKER